MIDFSTLKSLTIPEGEVVKIADTSGNVLWEKAPEGATVTISTTAGFEAPVIRINGQVQPDNAVLTVPIGTVISISGATQIQVGYNNMGSNYDYTVKGNVIIQKAGTRPAPYVTVCIVQIIEQ